MSGFTQSQDQSILDTKFPTSGATNYIMYSETASSPYTESANLARTPIGATGWSAATAAKPSVKSNNTALTSAGATAACTIYAVAIADAATGGNQIVDWQALGSPITLNVNDQITWAINALQVTEN